LQLPKMRILHIRLHVEIVFMVVLPILHDQNKIEVRCNTWMCVLHDGGNAGVVFGDLFQIHLHFDPINAYLYK
jgi:hypothetical protein